MFKKSVLIGASIFAWSVSANAEVIGNVGDSPYVAGDAITGGSKMILSDGTASISVDPSSKALFQDNTLSLSSGSACIDLGANQSINVAGVNGELSTFNADNAASIALLSVDGAVKFMEVGVCEQFAYTQLLGFTGVSTTLVAGTVFVVAGVGYGIKRNNDSEESAASPDS